MAEEMRLIDAKDFELRVSQRCMTEVFPNWEELPKEVQDMICKHGKYLGKLLETQPTVDAAPVVHSQWDTVAYERHRTISAYSHSCPECKYVYGDIKFKGHNYCPNCGAKMDGGNDHG